MKKKESKTIVVGAGIAGLTTAYRLHQKGMDVEIYEARHRVGGRILTAKVGGKIAELGGQNIPDGGEAKHIRRLIEEFDLELIGGKGGLNDTYFSEKKPIDVQQLLRKRQFNPQKLKTDIHDLAQKSKNLGEVLAGILGKEDPLYKILSVRLSAYEGASPEKLSPFYAETLYHMLLGGLSSAHQRAGGEEDAINLLAISGGNALLPEKLAEVLGSRLHLNKPLTTVSKNTDNSYLLTFQGGQKVKADILVLAIPCSVYGEIAFEKNILPEERLRAIQHVQYGANAKIVIPFSKPLLERIGLINDRLASFFDANRSVFTLYYTGEASKFSKGTILDLYKQDRPMMEKAFGDLCPPWVAPVMAQDRSFAAYEGPVGYSWPRDPYAKGSYSYIAPGQETLFTETREERGERVKTLFAPIDQRLYFAGEHASVLAGAAGTMEGACESGERVARMILLS